MSTKTITIRERKGKKGVTLVLDIYEDGQRYFETLKDDQGQTLKIFENPKSTEERQHNKLIRQYAQTIKAKREAELLTGNYSVKAKENFNKADFLAFILLVAEQKNSKELYHQLHIFLKKRQPIITFQDINKVEFLEKVKSWLLADLKQSSAKTYYNLLCHVLRIAHKKGIINTNNIEKVESIKSPPKVLKYLELDELKQLFSTPPPKSKYDVKTICLFAFYTLLRVSDIYSLKWKNIVKIGGSWYIQKNIQKIQSEKIIALNEQAVSLLPERGQDDDYVFNLFQHKFKKVHNFGITMDGLIRKWAKSAGLTKKVSMHTFRHSGATAMVTAGVDIYTISKQLTHSSIATSQIYAQVVLDKQKEAANKMPKVF